MKVVGTFGQMSFMLNIYSMIPHLTKQWLSSGKYPDDLWFLFYGMPVASESCQESHLPWAGEPYLLYVSVLQRDSTLYYAIK
jgi:hypothetical protein